MNVCPVVVELYHADRHDEAKIFVDAGSIKFLVFRIVLHGYRDIQGTYFSAVHLCVHDAEYC